MPTSNKNDAKGLSKLALLASAAATAAFVISQTRLMERLSEHAPQTPDRPRHEPEEHQREAPSPDEPATGSFAAPPADDRETEPVEASAHNGNGHADVEIEAPGHNGNGHANVDFETSTHDENGYEDSDFETSAYNGHGYGDVDVATSAQNENGYQDADFEDASAEDEASDDEPSQDEDGSFPPPATAGGGGRVRFRGARSVRERLHYGLPVRHSRRRPARPETEIEPAVEPAAMSETATTEAAVLNEPLAAQAAVAETPARELAAMIEMPVELPTAVALLAPPAPSTPAIPPETPVLSEDDFDADYLALVEAITHDGSLEEDDEEAEVEVQVEAKPVAEAETVIQPVLLPTPVAAAEVEEVWWLPAPSLRYILAALVYVAASAAVGSDPVSLALDGLRALTAVNSTADLIVVGWILCGLIFLIPLGTLALRFVALATNGKLHRPGFLSRDTAESAGWSLRLLATSAFIAGAVLYSPDALGWALNTDHPVASVASSSMAPALDEGELVLIDGVASVDDLNIGDIVAFTHDQGIAVRRVTGFNQDGIVTHADTDPDTDYVIQFEDIAGRVLKLAGTQVKLPLLGNISLLGERTVDPLAASSQLP